MRKQTKERDDDDNDGGREREKNSIFHKMKMCIREEGTWQNGGDAIRMNVRARERDRDRGENCGIELLRE